MSYPYRSRSFQPREPKYRRNGKIRAREVRVVDENKQQLGVMALNEALRLAQNKGMDLLEIVPNAVPPVCRIVNYGKFQYEESKRAKEHHSRQGGANKIKELQLTPGIAAHDFDTKLAHAIHFLSQDMKICVKLRFRGRQRIHKEFGFQVVNRFVTEAAAYGRADAPPKMLGERDLSVILSPLPRDKRPKTMPAAPRPAPAIDVESPSAQPEPNEILPVDAQEPGQSELSAAKE